MLFMQYTCVTLMQVSLSSIEGTGPDGRILKADIEDYLGSSLVSFDYL